MKLSILLVLAVVVFVECDHTFIGTNVLRPLILHKDMEYSSITLKKRVENIYYEMPPVHADAGRVIQGILAIDKTDSSASANVTGGGVGYTFVNLRMKSELNEPLHYNVYIYA